MMLNRLPETTAFAPTFKLTKSPVAVVVEVGDQSNEAKRPEVKPVVVVATFRSVPEESVLAAPVLMSTNLPVLILLELK